MGSSAHSESSHALKEVICPFPGMCKAFIEPLKEEDRRQTSNGGGKLSLIKGHGAGRTQRRPFILPKRLPGKLSTRLGGFTARQPQENASYKEVSSRHGGSC